MVVVDHRLAVAFELALAVNLSGNQTQLEAQVVLGNFVAAVQNGGIERRQFLDLENEVHLGTVVHIIDPGRHVVKEAGLVEGGNGFLHLIGQGRRRISLAVTDTYAA